MNRFVTRSRWIFWTLSQSARSRDSSRKTLSAESPRLSALQPNPEFIYLEACDFAGRPVLIRGTILQLKILPARNRELGAPVAQGQREGKEYVCRANSSNKLIRFPRVRPFSCFLPLHFCNRVCAVGF